MTQCRRSIFVGLVLTAVMAVGCEKRAAPADSRGPVTVASLVPAASDLIVGMGAGEHVVAVSNFDVRRPNTEKLPRVGDYQTIDWEKIAGLKPTVLIIQFAPDRVPAGLRERADSMGIRLLNIHIERLDDIFTTLRQLGDAIGEKEKADVAAHRLRGRIDAVRARVKDLPPVLALIVRDESGVAVFGRNNFVDDCLVAAGGVNVIPDSLGRYPSVDPEFLRSLRPTVVLQLLPKASPQVVESAGKVWTSLRQTPQWERVRVVTLTEEFTQQPGYQIGELAELFDRALHPGPAASGRAGGAP